MKVFAALAAALALAPMAFAQTCTTAANLAVLNQLTITQKVRSRVNGGGKVRQTILIKNTGSTSVTGVSARGGALADLVFSRGSSKPTATYTSATSAFGPNTVTGTAVTIPAGKALKATIM